MILLEQYCTIKYCKTDLKNNHPNISKLKIKQDVNKLSLKDQSKIL